MRVGDSGGKGFVLLSIIYEIRELTADPKGKDTEGAKGIYFVWIPAFAGMTREIGNDRKGMDSPEYSGE